MQTKHFLVAMGFLLLSKPHWAQPTIELSTSNFAAGLGPTTSSIGPISFMRDQSNTNAHVPLTGPDATQATFRLSNQQYSGLAYNNISTGLVFGAQPTTASGGAVQQVNPLDLYNNLGYFEVDPGGPEDNMFTVSPSFPAGTGIVCKPQFSPNPPDVNGAISVFTAAQVQFDRPGGPSVHNSATRYYYGDLVIDFNRFIRNPVIHIAGLGGAYRYFPVTGNNINDPSQWRSSFFSTELEIQGFTISRLSGNSNFGVNGGFIVNTSAAPSGASVNTTGGLFNEFGAASGSIRIAATLQSVVIRVYLRGSDASQFPWSTVQSNVASSSRNPFTGDIWWVSVSSSPDQLVPLPSTGLALSGQLLSSKQVQLNWKTQTEINTQTFELQRSTDGVQFQTINSRSAAGNTVTEQQYRFTDATMQVPVYYYRVKLIDLDGRITYSNVVVIRNGAGGQDVNVYPNPALQVVNLEFMNAPGEYDIDLISQSGQQLRRSRNVITGASQTITLERGALPAGIYTLRISRRSDQQVTLKRISFQ